MKKLTLTIAVLAIAGLSSAALNIQNANFDNDSAWAWGDSNTGWGSTSDTYHDAVNGTGVAYVNSTEGGGYAVIHQKVSVAGSGIQGGDVVTMSAFVQAAVGESEGIALLKLESWGGADGSTDLGAAVEHVFTASEAGAIESFDYTVASGTTYLTVVVGATGGWGGATAQNGNFSFDNVQVVPEPATMGLIGLFGGGMMALRRFRIC